MSDHSLITYSELDTAKSRYMDSARTIEDLEGALSTLNKTLGESWQNETANSFFERYEAEYGPGLRKTMEALQSISEFIRIYAEKQQDLDQEISSSIQAGD